MQRLFEPEDPVWRDGAGKFDAVRQVVGRIHVEHQQGLVADRPAHRADPLRFLSHSAAAGLELDRAVAEFDEPRQLFAVIGVGHIRPIITTGGIGEDRPVLAAEQPVYRQAGGLPLDIPQGDVDSGDRRHHLGPLAARDGRRQAVAAGDPAWSRRGQREQFFPHRDVSQRIHPADNLTKAAHPLADPRHRRAVDFAIADEPVIGAHLGQDDVPGFALFVRGPNRLRPRHRDHVGRDRSDPGHQAVSCKLRPSSSIICWRIRNFWILPVTVIGKPSTNLT